MWVVPNVVNTFVLPRNIVVLAILYLIWGVYEILPIISTISFGLGYLLITDVLHIILLGLILSFMKID
jgi:hypothetical protein